MVSKIKIVFAVIALCVLASCERIKDSSEDCGVWLEFVFDHNMEHADSFDPQVKTVDVYVFDREGKFILTRHAAIDDLVGRKRMFLREGLTFGKYRVLTVGNLGASFSFTDVSGQAFTPGVTSIEDVELALNTAHSAREFDHLYFAFEGPVEVEYRANTSIWKVPLIRETNRFNIMLQTVVESDGTPEGPVEPIHTVEIAAPESGAYDYLNNPTVPTALVYSPYSLLSRLEYTEDGTLFETAAKINTMRLLDNEWDGYRIVVRSISTGEELWSYSLLSLLEGTGEDTRPDGTALPFPEYLDRQGDWAIVIVYTTPEDLPAFTDQAFIAVTIRVNGWILRLDDIGV